LLTPVTVKQILHASQAHPDAPFQIDGSELSQVTFIGFILQMQEQSTNINYQIADGTGCIDVRMWIDDKDTDYSAQKRSSLRYFLGLFWRSVSAAHIETKTRSVCTRDGSFEIV
jgi:hypothetical protein